MRGQSAYGAGAPTYTDASLQQFTIDGRLKVARGILERALADGNQRRAVRWQQIVDELLDRRLETRGR